MSASQITRPVARSLVFAAAILLVAQTTRAKPPRIGVVGPAAQSGFVPKINPNVSQADQDLGLRYKVFGNDFGLEVLGTGGNSPARLAGLEPGDVITHVRVDAQNRRVRNVNQFKAAVRVAGQTVNFWVRDARDPNNYQWVKLTRNDPPVANPNPGAAPNLNGAWRSNLGSVIFNQVGNNVTGIVNILFGGTSQISGTIIGNTLQFSWQSDFPHGMGTGTLNLSANGNVLNGPYRNQLDGTTGFWSISR